MDKKEIKEAYKNRLQVGGIVALKNIKNDKWLVEYTQDIKAAQNKFNFFKENYSLKIKKDYLAQDGDGFIFKVLDSLEKKDDQDEKEFVSDLVELYKLWLEKLNGQELY